MSILLFIFIYFAVWQWENRGNRLWVTLLLIGGFYYYGFSIWGLLVIALVYAPELFGAKPPWLLDE